MRYAAALNRKGGEKWLRRFARIGLAAYVIVYCLMSILSVLAATGFKKEAAGKSEAFKTIYEQPMGRVLLIIIGFSILGYVTLRLFQAFGDTRHEGKDTRGIFIRIWMFSSALVYMGLSYTALSLALYKPDGDGEQREVLLKKVLDQPWGAWLVGIVGLIFVGAGCWEVYRGIFRKFMKFVTLHNSSFKKTFVRIGMVGHVARGLVFCTIGYLLIRAATDADPGEAKNTDGAFDFLKESFGNWIMGLVALGLLAYGLFVLVRARHEKMNFDQK